MKVLISAIACNPYSGSELYFGWSAVKALARDHELWVMTGTRNQPSLERATAEGLVPPNVHFIYAGHFAKSHPNRMKARLQSWRDYHRFSKGILPLAKALHEKEQFDLVHHVTYAAWRVASPLWQLDIPFVFGPIGGYEHFPPNFFPILSPLATAFELARMASNLTSRFSPAVRASLRRAAHVFAANQETEQLVAMLRCSRKGVSQLLPGFFSETKIQDFGRFSACKPASGPLRLFAAGSMEGRKGVALALQALALVKKAGVRFDYQIRSAGPEVAFLKQLTTQLGLESEVQFGENLQGEAYQKELGATHVFLLPSFRESAGLTMMEAMLAGCVPVVADAGGPGFIVSEDSGYKIPTHSRKQMVNQIAETILSIDRDRNIIQEKGRAACHRIVTAFSEEHYRNTVNAVYLSITRAAQQN